MASLPAPRSFSQLLFQHPSRKVLRRPLQEFLAEAAWAVAPRRKLTCLIASDDDLRALNVRFRGKAYPADVLSFPPESGSDLGEIAISLDRAWAQAEEMGHSVEEELRILMLHGILHLTGLDHEKDTGEMARAERAWRKRFGLPHGLIERSRTVPS
jgi:probable rRNA maturation factor